MAKRGWGEEGVEYRPIPAHKGYFAGSDGSVWSTLGRVPRKRKPYALPNRRLYISFASGQLRQLSHLILEAFVGPKPEGLECCHGNGDCQDNRPGNLRWDTHEANIADLHRHGGNRATRGERNCNAVLDADGVREIMRLTAAGLKPAEVGRCTGVRPGRVREIVGGFCWSHVTGLPKRSRRAEAKRKTAKR